MHWKLIVFRKMSTQFKQKKYSDYLWMVEWENGKSINQNEGENTRVSCVVCEGFSHSDLHKIFIPKITWKQQLNGTTIQWQHRIESGASRSVQMMLEVHVCYHVDFKAFSIHRDNKTKPHISSLLLSPSDACTVCTHIKRTNNITHRVNRRE